MILIFAFFIFEGGQVIPVSWRNVNEDAEDAHPASRRLEVRALIFTSPALLLLSPGDVSFILNFFCMILE